MVIEKLIAEILSSFGKELMDKYFERKDQWDRVEKEIEGLAKDNAITALEYLAARGELTYRLRDDAGDIVLPDPAAGIRGDAAQD